jgi:protein-S-isoprenylcysteine O-methyltransferase Ste14
MTVHAVVNGVVIVGVVLVMAVVTRGLWTTPRPSGPLTGRTLPVDALPGWRLAALVLIGYVFLSGVTVLLWIPIPGTLSTPAKNAAAVAGSVAFVAGVLLVLWGRHALGPMWTVTTSMGVRLHTGHQLIRTGPYAIVRHPMYLGFWLLLAGTVLIYRTWVLVAYLLLAMARFSGRARMEERALAAAFGPEWREYAGRVPMWVPRRSGRRP